MNKLKWKTHSTLMPKQIVRVGEKIIKLREERQLLARFFVIQQSRPELVPKLAATIAEYEISVLPRYLFPNDVYLLIPTDKSSLMLAVEEQEAKSISEKLLEPNAAVAQDVEAEANSDNITNISLQIDENGNCTAIIYDDMALWQGIKRLLQ